MAKKVTKKKTSTRKKAPKKKTTSGKAVRTAEAAPMAPTVTDEAIRVRAFEIYRSGQNPSNPDADWLQAERELKTEITT